MGTIFVAYGGAGRETVLEFAVDRAMESGDGLYVFHTSDSSEEDPAAIRAEIESVLDRTGADLQVDIDIERTDGGSDDRNVSAQKRLTDALFGSEHSFTYAVMGNVERGAVETFVLPSMTEAVLETREIPVLLVPV